MFAALIHQLSTMTTWAWVCAALMLLLAGYSLAHYTVVAAFLMRRRPKAPGGACSAPVTVAIPARNEGACAVRALRSVDAQDHEGAVRAVLVLADRDDTALPFLAEAWPDVDLSAGDVVDLAPGVQVAFCGAGPKHDKVNWLVGRTDTPWFAILDCDHAAEPGWLRTSVALLRAGDARLVQGRRAPLDAGGFFSLWDSLHQHVGCEVLNDAFTHLGLTVFFTGTTAVLETELLRERPLRDCITEDIDLAYDLVLDGERIAANPHAGSAEEVSPDLYSFLARRRRWAHGHTDAFLRHLPRLRASDLSVRQKAQFLLHGAHYLVALPVFVLHLAIGLFFLAELPAASAGAAAAVGAILAARMAGSQRTIGWGRVVEALVAFAWLTPAVVIAMNLVVAALVGELWRATLPLPAAVQVLGVVGFVAPLVLLLAGMLRFRQLSPSSALAVVCTYPLAFYADVCGVLFGLADRVIGRPQWKAVARPAPGAVASAPRSIRASWTPALTLAAVRRAIPAAVKPARLVVGILVVGLFAAGVLYSPVSRIPVEDAVCEVLQADAHPWIVGADRLDGYCQEEHGPRWSERTGEFAVQRDEVFTSLDPDFWDTMDSTFPCNLAHFQPGNVATGDGLSLTLQPEVREDRAYTSGNIATKDVPGSHHLYGRFEAELKAAKGSGLLTAFFLYRFDPWQEIDAEFVGRDTSKLLINVFYNPGVEGDLYNYGYRGTPVLVDLGFDASEDFHRYAIEWDPDGIRWFVDDRLVHVRHADRPTPIPHLPMRFHVNLWPTCSEELAGPLDPTALPATAHVRNVTISSWTPAPRSGVVAALQSMLPQRPRTPDWRDDASWIQPGR